MINKLLSANHDIARKVEEIANLRSENSQLKSKLTIEKEFIKRMNKPKEAIRLLYENIQAQRIAYDTTRLDNPNLISSTKQGESSKHGEWKNAKTKKPKCYHYGKLGHTKKIVGEKLVSLIPSLTSMGIVLIATSVDIKHTNVDKRHRLHLYLKVIAVHVKSMVTRHKIANLMQNTVGYPKVKAMQLDKEII